ncbi:MAG: RsmB/NOP family class I SAM-dependent RNA methyltransferase [Verrucomicrobiales bacterium]
MTKKEPSNLMRKAAAELFPESGENQATFLSVLLSPRPRGNAVIWTVPRRDGELGTVSRSTLPEWIPDEIELLQPGIKIGLSDAFQKGEVYSLDFSSVITGSAMLALRDTLPPSPRILDLCAAPGGKSILASVLLKPGLILANEVEGKRLGILRHNLSRCRVADAFTQRLQPEDLLQLAPEQFDLCLIDAPCSGQSLLAKGIENPGCFHPSVIKGNARRQLRIIEAGAGTVSPGGSLLYTTCTFSLRENEGVIEKFLKRHADFEAVEVAHLSDFTSPFSAHPCYRVYPHLSECAGGFAALLKRRDDGSERSRAPLSSSLVDYPVSASSKDDTD